MITQQNIEEILNNGGHLVGTDGHKIGSIGQFYVDDDSGNPSWVTAKTGLFGSSESFVPLSEATVDGNDVRVPYDKDQVKDAPRMEADSQLSPEEEDRLYKHYGVGTGTDTGTDTDSDTGNDTRSAAAGTYSGVTTGTDDMRGERTGTHLSDDDFGTDADDRNRDDGHDTSGPNTDEAMTRSEEELHVGTEKHETGRARLRKYVVTEDVETTVPVSHEEVRVEREPITDANRGNASSGAELSEEEHEVVLNEERPVVEKETVPAERVRLDKETVTDEAHVNEEVRKERIEAEGVDDDGRDRR
ncbi:YsnF/AvaK domain-containing protein [Arthrobacter roseus]|uniref:YsnF/AvaK domain-containing protein n=1 Tax=Arthrobacter roseus TaxID=136274 RepID=UPI0019647557|nr:YsnF/AvaK domain-containing protein [Arthrobacter roseus]MBM7847919.1 uncharacterized protein (TIGR02271 family) [Arthrobacter roseus]